MVPRHASALKDLQWCCSLERSFGGGFLESQPPKRKTVLFYHGQWDWCATFVQDGKKWKMPALEQWGFPVNYS